jgi:uncharacterized protein with HEPN domain
MSHREPEKYLYDMLSSCEFLLKFTRSRTVKDYIEDRAFRSAIERELQIIGEALLQLDKVNPEIARQIPDYLNIIGFRHILVHGYDSLNPTTVWNIIETKLESLKTKVQSLLRKR